MGFPPGRTFKTKPELAWEIVQRLQAKGIPFDAMAMDDLYGRNAHLRKRLDHAGLEYYGDIPENTVMYLDKPQIVYPMTKRGKPSKATRLLRNIVIQPVSCGSTLVWNGLTSPFAPKNGGNSRLASVVAKYGWFTKVNVIRHGS